MTVTERIALTAKMDPVYAETLKGPRTRGSTTEKAITEYDNVEFLPFSDQTCAGPGTMLLSGYCKGIGGKQLAMKLGSLLEMGVRPEFRNGAHGWELYVPKGQFAVDKPVNTSRVILVVATAGNPDGLEEGALVTWYPGTPTAHLDMEVGVKLV